MSSPRDPSSSVSPRVQAARQEQAVRGDFLARAARDVDLMATGAASEALALIGGPSIRTAADAWRVALWLWNEAEQAGLNGPASILYNAMVHSKYPPPAEGQTRGWYFPARTRAGIALARQLMSVALETAGSVTPPPYPPQPHEMSAVLGEWWGSMIEGAHLSEVASTLYQMTTRAGLREATQKDAQILHRSAWAAWNSSDQPPTN